MSQYKVPQDVEADDKLLGPFTFRQIIYLFIAAGLCVAAFFLARIFLILVLIPAPLIILFGALALPIKKDQPMETYLAALISYYLKPHNRYWVPGQRESTIEITAPKIAEESRTRDISGDEASHRLSFLANIVDSEGRSIRNDSSTIVREELINEANEAKDIFDTYSTQSLDQIISNRSDAHHAEIVNQMKEAIQQNDSLASSARNGQLPKISPSSYSSPAAISMSPATPTISTRAPQKPVTTPEPALNTSKPAPTSEPTPAPEPAPAPDPDLVALANNPDLSIQTIAKQANRINQSRIDETTETFISLH